ncbi:hypothetical protein [Afipia clevelandensis]|uniref:Uncharacterized protein n=1 Tax=Afipia clevelandensis ATCC 49720 TaxID=883079 RepID=K8PHJ0_9BRAD|nr:hypothetical protein [Afipia clevelandensis]EKS37798.1 hypothetical protein HMPREF9696_01748 [Afipia clevelandensis ATCC 49720]
MTAARSDLMALAELFEKKLTTDVRTDWSAQLVNDPSEYNYINISIRIPAAKKYLDALRLAASQPDREAWREIIKQPDERELPTYGQIPWDQLGRDVVGAQFAHRRDYDFDSSFYPGHQMVPQINFNSLARIVDKYRYYGLPCTEPSLLSGAGTKSDGGGPSNLRNTILGQIKRCRMSGESEEMLSRWICEAVRPLIPSDPSPGPDVREAWATLRSELLWQTECNFRQMQGTNWTSFVEQMDQAISALTRPLGGFVQGSIATKQSTDPEGSSRTETALDILEQNCWDLRCVDIPTGAGDADIGWHIVEHHMAPPKERIIGYGNAPLDALMDAMSRGPK